MRCRQAAKIENLVQRLGASLAAPCDETTFRLQRRFLRGMIKGPAPAAFHFFEVFRFVAEPADRERLLSIFHELE